jgi:hypothetical protein
MLGHRWPAPAGKTSASLTHTGRSRSWPSPVTLLQIEHTLESQASGLSYDA